MNRFKRSLALAKSSWSVIRGNRGLLRYPLISGAAVTILGLAVILALAVLGLFGDGSDNSDMSVGGIIGLFVLYMVVYTVVIFCNVALVSEVMAVLNGHGSDRPSGWAVARSKIKSIVGYSAIAATVGVILNIFANNDDNRFGQILAIIGSAAWSLATFLVVPVLVVEDVGPVDALKKSATLLKRTWGEQIIGNAGIGLVTGLATFVVILAGAALVFLAVATSITALVVIAAIVAALAVAAVLVVTTAMGTVYSAAVYRYATQEPIQNFPAAELLPTAFVSKPAKKVSI